jgi:hypothetical protein
VAKMSQQLPATLLVAHRWLATVYRNDYLVAGQRLFLLEQYSPQALDRVTLLTYQLKCPPPALVEPGTRGFQARRRIAPEPATA